MYFQTALEIYVIYTYNQLWYAQFHTILYVKTEDIVHLPYFLL